MADRRRGALNRAGHRRPHRRDRTRRSALGARGTPVALQRRAPAAPPDATARARRRNGDRPRPTGLAGADRPSRAEQVVRRLGAAGTCGSRERVACDCACGHADRRRAGPRRPPASRARGPHASGRQAAGGRAAAANHRSRRAQRLPDPARNPSSSASAAAYATGSPQRLTARSSQQCSRSARIRRDSHHTAG